MKKKYKNFIAFTLSEMMIVLLIISVISAATLPAITSRDEVKVDETVQQGSTVNIASNWMPDSTYTKGYYYRKNNATQIVIGPNLASSTSFNRTSANNTYGMATLVLNRAEKITMSTEQRIYANSDIAFYNKFGEYKGGLGFDLQKNLSIGKYAGQVKTIFTARGSYDNVSIGYYSSANQTNASEQNTTIGAYAGYGVSQVAQSVIIGPYARNFDLSIAPNVIIGSHAVENSKISSASVVPPSYYISIGAYSGYSSSIGGSNNINVGYYAGAGIGYSGSPSSYAVTNIGAYAGYGATNTFSESSSVENIGYFAGAKSTNTSDLSNTNIGYYAGYGVIRYENINIGQYAGTASSGSVIARNDINIGKFAGRIRGNSGNSVNIGNYAGLRTSSSDSNSRHNIINIGRYAGAGSDVFSGYSSVNIGEYAGYNASGTANVFIGYYAGAGSSGSNNIVLGSNTLSNPTSKSISGNYNVLIGCTPSSSLSGDYSYCVGAGSYLKDLTDTSSSYIWTGTSASRPANLARQMFFAPPGIKMASSVGFSNTAILLYAKYVASPQSFITRFSDRRIKENIKETKYGIDKLRNIAVYQYKMIGSPEPHIGVIAQEVIKHYPYAVTKAPETIKKGGYYTVNADWFIYSLVQSVKDVDKFVNDLNSDLSKNILKISTLIQKTVKLENKLNLIAKSQQETNKQLTEMEKILVKMERK